MKAQTLSKVFSITYILWFDLMLLCLSFQTENIFLKVLIGVQIATSILSLAPILNSKSIANTKKKIQRLILSMLLVVVTITGVIIWILNFIYQYWENSPQRIIIISMIVGVLLFSIITWVLSGYVKEGEQ